VLDLARPAVGDLLPLPGEPAVALLPRDGGAGDQPVDLGGDGRGRVAPVALPALRRGERRLPVRLVVAEVQEEADGLLDALVGPAVGLTDEVCERDRQRDLVEL